MAKSKRSCYLCGTAYEYCDCARQPAFMATFCSENCRDIFKTLSSYGVGLISAEECKELLDCCDLSNKGSYNESVINTIEKVYAASVKIEEVVDEPIEEQVFEIPVLEESEEFTPNFERESKKRHEVVLEDIE